MNFTERPINIFGFSLPKISELFEDLALCEHGLIELRYDSIERAYCIGAQEAVAGCAGTEYLRLSL